jgi:agmatinase
VIVLVPFDSVNYGPGARFGPDYIRAFSKLLRPYNPALDVKPFGAVQVADANDLVGCQNSAAILTRAFTQLARIRR